MEASTGQNDPSSVWGSGLFSAVDSLTKSAGNILTAVKGNNAPNTKAPPALTPASNAAIPIWAIIGGGVALVLVLVFALRK